MSRQRGSPPDRTPPPGLRWRTRGRAVSPVIATILIVAMVVVLAAILYTLVGRLAQGQNAIPLGSSLALGPAQSMGGSSVGASYCQVGHMCYAVAIASARGSLAIGNLNFVLKNGVGAVISVGNGTGGYSVVNNSGGVLAHSPTVSAGSPLVVTIWTYTTGYSVATLVSSSLTVWVDFGTGTGSAAGHGYVLEAVGTGSYDGDVDIALP